MARKLSLVDRFIGKIFRFQIPIEKVVTIFGYHFNNGSNHIKETLEAYDKNPHISYRETPLYSFLKDFSPTYLKDYIKGVECDLPIFDFPWGELISGMTNKNMSHSRFCGPSTDEFIQEEYNRIIHLYHKLKKEGYKPKSVPGGTSAGTFMIDNDWKYRFIVLQGNHRVPILQHLGYKYLCVSIYPFYIRPYVLFKSLQSWENVKNDKCSVRDAETVFNFYFKNVIK